MGKDRSRHRRRRQFERNPEAAAIATAQGSAISGGRSTKDAATGSSAAFAVTEDCIFTGRHPGRSTSAAAQWTLRGGLPPPGVDPQDLAMLPEPFPEALPPLPHSEWTPPRTKPPLSRTPGRGTLYLWCSLPSPEALLPSPRSEVTPPRTKPPLPRTPGRGTLYPWFSPPPPLLSPLAETPPNGCHRQLLFGEVSPSPHPPPATEEGTPRTSYRRRLDLELFGASLQSPPRRSSPVSTPEPPSIHLHLIPSPL